ncbi:hypothetical protein D3C75_835290 [compost metagenome]
MVTDAMAMAFHGATTDGSIGADDVEEIKTGLRAALANFAAPQLPQPAVVIPLGVTWEDVPDEITEDDMGLASAWAHGFNQCRAAMLQGNHRDLSQPVDPQVAAYEKIMQQALPANSFTNHELEGMAHGDNPQSNAYRELLAYRLKAAALPAGLVAAMELAIEQSDRRAGEVRPGYPQHYHTVRGVWDQSNGCIAHELCSVCALWDEMRDYLAAPQREAN